jgi:ferredoxin-NADP reductase
LPFASLQHTSPHVAKTLLSVEHNAWLRITAEAGRLRRIELWRVLERLRAEGYPMDRLLESPQLLCEVLEPECPRTYSIASGAPQSVWGASSFELAVRLHAHETGVGTASSFLCRSAETDVEVPFSVQRAAAFGPTPDPHIPVVGFAAGSGVAPMLSLFAERCRISDTRNWLILSLSRTDDFQFSKDWSHAVASGQLRLDVVFTRQGATLQHSGDGFTIAPGANRHIQDLLKEGNVARDLHAWLSGNRNHPPASVYICGNGSFASTAMGCIESVVASRSFGDEHARAQAGRTALFEMAGQRRLTIEAHTDATPSQDDGLFTPADVAEHNCDANGYWVSIRDVVYDLSEFRLLHPGGARILDAYAGMDATHGFSRAHDGRPDIAAQLETYRKGRLYAPRFESKTVTIETPQGPRSLDHAALYRAYVTALNLCTEMQNALRIDLSLAEQRVHPETASPSPYIWARQAETHHRFLATYVSVLSADTLPTLDLFARALHGVPEEMEFSGTHSPGDSAHLALANLQAASELVSSVCDANMQSETQKSRITRLVNQDQRLLAELKQLLRRAVNAVAYRESPELGAVHATLALNAMCRMQVEEYQRTIASFGS